MSTDFNTGTIVAGGSLKFDNNVPTDIRTRVNTRSDIKEIPKPFVGMQVYVIDEDNIYTINGECFDTDDFGFIKFKDDWENGLSKIATSKNWQSIINNDTLVGPSGNSIIKRYCLGTEDAPNYGYNRMSLENQGWEINRPEINDAFGFVWSIEAIVTNNNTELVEPGWSETPLRENGAKGDKGDQGLTGETTAVAYLDNPMDSVLLDADNNVTAGFPCSTNFYVFQGTGQLKVTDLKWEASEDLESNSVDVTYSDTYATLTIKKLPTSTSAKVSFTLTATANGVKYKAVYLINKITASAPNIVVDMANDNINIPCDSNGTILDGVLPLKNTINAFKAGEPMVVTSATTTISGVECSLNDNTITISRLPNFTDALTIDLDVTLDDGTNRVVSFRIIKVVPGAPGEAAEFWEIGTESHIIKVNSNNEIINTPFKVYLLHREGLKSTKVEVGDSSIPSNMKLYYSIDSDGTTHEISSGEIDLSNAITGVLDLDRYLSLSLVLDGELVDGPERIYMVKDGEPGPQGDTAVIYRLVANNHTIKKDNVNGLKDSNTEINVSILRIDGETSSTITVNQLSEYTGDAYDIYKYTDGRSELVNSDNQLKIPTTEMEDVNDYIRYELVYTQTGSDEPDIRDSVTIDVLYDGVDGADGRIMYYDDVWVSGKLYESDDTSTPYVYDKTGPKGYNYFFLVRESYNGTVSPYSDWNANNAKQEHSWKPIPNFEAIYANVGLFDTATVGPAVFYKDWVFSQNDTNGDPNHMNFTFDETTGKPTGDIVPAIWFNFVTGQGSLANGQISWDKLGNVKLGPKVELSWDSITDAPLSLSVSDHQFGGEINNYIWVQDNVTFNGENGWSIWISEEDMDQYENNGHLNADIFGTAFYGDGKNATIGDTCITGSLHYNNDEDEWTEAEAIQVTITSISGRSSNLTAEDVTNIVKTKITGDWITTGTINAKDVNIENLNASNINMGKLGARMIDVDNLVVSKLDTKPSQTDTTGKITIEGNDMIIYNHSTVKPAIKICGDELPDLSSTAPVSPGRKEYEFNGGTALARSGSTTVYNKIGSITVDANHDLTVSPETPYDLALKWSDGTEYGYHTNVSFGLNFVSSNQTNLFRATMDFSFNTGRDAGGSGIVITGGDLIPVIDGNSGYTLSKGKTYDIYEVYLIEFEDPDYESELSIQFGFRQYEDSTDLVHSTYIHYEYHTPTDRISELAADGIRFRQSPYEYFETCGNEMIIQDYYEAMGFNANGLWIAQTTGDTENSIIWSKPKVESDGTLKFATSTTVPYQQIRNTMFRH